MYLYMKEYFGENNYIKSLSVHIYLYILEIKYYTLEDA